MATIESPSPLQLTFLIQCPIFMITNTENSELKFRRKIKAGTISKFRYNIPLLIFFQNTVNIARLQFFIAVSVNI
jgi:hypothetical protein